MSSQIPAPWDPMIGEKLGPAWQAVIPVLADGAWHPWAEVLSAARSASTGLLDRSIETMLLRGVQEGDLCRKGVAGKQRDGRMLRFTRYGYARWVAHACGCEVA